MRSGRLLGFDYVVNPVWLLAFAILLVALVTSLSGAGATELPAIEALMVSAAVVALFALCIVAHELSHALVARRLGLPQTPIQLLTIGRPSDDEPDPEAPSSEIAVAMTGPGVSGATGLVLVAGATIVAPDPSMAASAPYWLILWLGLSNLALAGFYLVPVLPLDGGRILRALAWAATHDLERATLVTAFVGRMFGYLVIGSGLFIALSVDLVGGIWLVALGWFTTRLAKSAVDRRRMQELTAGLSVADATDTHPAVVVPSMAVETLLIEDDQRAGRGEGQGVYPVIEDDRLLGFVFSARLRGPLRRKRPDERVRDVLIPPLRAPSLRPDDPLLRAAERLETSRSDGLPVLSADEPDRLYGVLTRARVLDRLRARQALQGARGGSASSGARG